MGKHHRPRSYDKPFLANHVSKYASRHPENAGRPLTETAESRPQKKPAATDNPIRDFQKDFLAAAKAANLMDYPTATRTQFANALTEAVMMKSTRAVLQDAQANADEFADTLCENLFRRVRDHHAGSKDANLYGRLLQQTGAAAPRQLEDGLRETLARFACDYFTRHGDDLKSALKWQRSEGR